MKQTAKQWQKEFMLKNLKQGKIYTRDWEHTPNSFFHPDKKSLQTWRRKNVSL